MLNDSQLSKRELKRLALIENSIEIIGEIGIDKITLKEVASNLNIKQTALLHHYKSKDNFFFKVINFIVRKNNQMVQNLVEKSTGHSIDAYVKGNINWALRNRKEAGIILFLYYKASFDLQYKKFYSEIKKSAENRILLMLNEKDKNYTINDARALHEMIIGGILHFIVSNNDPSQHEIQSLKKRLQVIIKKDLS